MTNRILIALTCVLIAPSGCTTTDPVRSSPAGEIGSGLGSATAAPRSTSVAAPRPTPTAAPRPISIDGQQACTIVDEAVVATVGMRDVPPQPTRNDWGTICNYFTGEVELTVLLTDGPNQGLAQLTPIKDAKVAASTVGRFPARIETIGGTCTFTVEPVPGRALQIHYFDPASDAKRRCELVTTLAIEAVSGLTAG